MPSPHPPWSSRSRDQGVYGTRSLAKSFQRCACFPAASHGQSLPGFPLCNGFDCPTERMCCDRDDVTNTRLLAQWEAKEEPIAQILELLEPICLCHLPLQQGIVSKVATLCLKCKWVSTIWLGNPFHRLPTTGSVHVNSLHLAFREGVAQLPVCDAPSTVKDEPVFTFVRRR